MLKLVKIDARGVSCPQPVLLTQKALKQYPEGVEVIVDNMTARNNVERYMKNDGYKVSVVEKEEEFLLQASR